MFSVRNGILAVAFAFVVFAPLGSAHAASTSDMLTMIQNLMTQIEELQKQLNAIRGDVKEVIANGLREGMTSEDIGKLQQLLATDPIIYPEGRVTKFFGPLTKEAVKRLQARHGLEITGVVDGETHDLLKEYLREGFGGTIPPGLLRAPGIMKKVEMRYSLGCEKKGHGMGPLCKKFHGEKGEHDDKDDDDDVKDDHFKVEVEIEDGDATITFKFYGTWYDITVDGTDADDVLDEVADELGKDVDNLDDHFVADIKDALEEALNDDEEDTEEFDVELDIENGTTTLDFDFDGENYDIVVYSTDEDDILEAVADELNEDVDDLDDDLVDAITDELNDELGNDDEAESDAEDAIDDAEDAINDAEDAIDDASGDTSDAEDLLDDARNTLDDAEDAFDDEDFADAEDLANDAEDLANDAVDAL